MQHHCFPCIFEFHELHCKVFQGKDFHIGVSTFCALLYHQTMHARSAWLQSLTWLDFVKPKLPYKWYVMHNAHVTTFQYVMSKIQLHGDSNSKCTNISVQNQSETYDTRMKAWLILQMVLLLPGILWGSTIRKIRKKPKMT